MIRFAFGKICSLEMRLDRRPKKENIMTFTMFFLKSKCFLGKVLEDRTLATEKP